MSYFFLSLDSYFYPFLPGNVFVNEGFFIGPHGFYGLEFVGNNAIYGFALGIPEGNDGLLFLKEMAR